MFWTSGVVGGVSSSSAIQVIGYIKEGQALAVTAGDTGEQPLPTALEGANLEELLNRANETIQMLKAIERQLSFITDEGVSDD